MDQETKKIIFDYLCLMKSQGLEVNIAYPGLGCFFIDLPDVFEYMEDNLKYIANKKFRTEKAKLAMWIPRRSAPRCIGTTSSGKQCRRRAMAVPNTPEDVLEPHTLMCPKHLCVKIPEKWMENVENGMYDDLEPLLSSKLAEYLLSK